MNNVNMNAPSSLNEMFQFDMNSMGTIAGPNDSFMSQLHDMSSFGSDSASFSAAPMPPSAGGTANSSSSASSSTSTDTSELTSKNRNRGNYRCSKCGEPKKGHVCPLVPTNFKCSRCGLPKKTCTCVAPTTRSIGVQVEMDEDMTTRVLDLSQQGVIEFHKSIVGYPSPPSASS